MIRDKLNEMLKDEQSGTDEYGLLAKEAVTSEDIPDKYKSAFINLFETMSRDEDKHLHFIKLMLYMLDQDNNK